MKKNIPKIAKWDNPITGNLDKRARAWLDINCAHCHNSNGTASGYWHPSSNTFAPTECARAMISLTGRIVPRTLDI